MPVRRVLRVPARARGDRAHQAASTATITANLRIMFGHLPKASPDSGRGPIVCDDECDACRLIGYTGSLPPLHRCSEAILEDLIGRKTIERAEVFGRSIQRAARRQADDFAAGDGAAAAPGPLAGG